MPEKNIDSSRYKEALELALAILIRLEPGDSRAVSDEFVAMAEVLHNGGSEESMSIIRAAQAQMSLQRTCSKCGFVGGLENFDATSNDTLCLDCAGFAPPTCGPMGDF